MVKLFCALVGAAGNAFSVRVDEGDSVDELKKAIKGEKQRTIKCDPDGLDLYLAKKGDAWLTEKEVKGVSDINGLKHLDVARAKLRRVGLSNDQVGEEDEDVDAAGNGPVNVLVVIPPEVEQPPHKKIKTVKTSSVIKGEDMKFIEKNLDIEAWQVGGGISLDIGRVESDFPEWFYVRKETLDIIQVFKDKMEAKLHIVFVGTPGVGKSMLVVLFAFYMALRQKKRVVLFRKKKGEGFSMLYLDTENNNCWRMDAAEIGDLDRQFLQGAELCLDGLRYDDIDRYFGKLGGFRLLATSVHYPDIPVLRRCLVPFWSSVDLNAIGAHLQWSKHEIKDRYFYSGGNLRDFLSEKIVVMDSIDQAVDLVDLPVAELLNTQYAVGSARQIDRLRMTGIPANDQSDLDKYMTSRSWCCVITSEYALRQLGKIVEASYYEVLWSKGRMLADDGLMDIAFENYVHTMARDGKKIKLQVRAYDRAKERQNTYVALEFEAKSCRNDGINAEECDAVMKQLSSSSDDYWYPSSRSLVTIDCVAKLRIERQSNAVGLIPITTSDHHKIDSKALDKYAKVFPGRSKYIALVPDKETSDEFRLSPADPPTEVPLDVAYITTWNL